MPNVLVVDGEPVTRDLIAGMLEEAGMTVQVAEADRDAERALDTGEFDVVVSAADPPRPALLQRCSRPTPPVLAVSGPTISCLPLLNAIRDLATR
jgi:DNA-binding response OmpR family regulator